MAQAYKVLDQTKIATADTYEDGYACPASTEAVISSITICNTGTDVATYSIRVLPSGGTEGDVHQIVDAAAIGPSETVNLKWGITLAASDKFRITADDTDVVFAFFGTEIT